MRMRIEVPEQPSETRNCQSRTGPSPKTLAGLCWEFVKYPKSEEKTSLWPFFRTFGRNLRKMTAGSAQKVPFWRGYRSIAMKKLKIFAVAGLFAATVVAPAL